MSQQTIYLVVREHAGHRIYYSGMDHAPDHVHTPRWQDTKTYAWAFATRGDAAIIAKKYGGHVAADMMFSHEEIAQQLDETRTGATLPTGPLGNWLLKQRLVRHNRKTGWFDLTPLGRQRLEDLRREVQ